jgi:hypothetical protein
VVGSEHGLDGRRIDGFAVPELIRDPGGLRLALELADVLLAATAVHRHHRHETAASDQADDEQPPLEFRHVAGKDRAAPRSAPRGELSRLTTPAYTRPR